MTGAAFPPSRSLITVPRAETIARVMRSAVLLSRRPIWRESLLWAELAALLRDERFKAPRRSGAPRSVLLIPGFLAGDRHLTPMKRWLEQAGHQAESAGIRFNVDCSAAAVARLERRLERFALRTGSQVTLIGESRGGLFARVLAVRRPDLVECIVTLGSPHAGPMRVHPALWLQGATLATVGSLGIPRIFRHSCRTGNCCAGFRKDLAAVFPRDVRFYSIYSRKDGIVDWEACLDNAARAVEIDSTHCGMAVNRMTYRFLGQLLDGPMAQAESTALPGQAAVALSEAA
jgi:triacylglycerol lipase